MGEGIFKGKSNEPQSVGWGTKRLMEKGDINGDYSRAQAATLTREESGIKNKAYENGRSVDAAGNVVYSGVGNRGSVTILRRTNNVTTHNHPNNNFRNPNSIAGRIGQSFSGTDIANAIANNAAGTRAVTSGYTFNISRPKGGWPKVSSRAVKATYTKALNKFWRENQSYRARGTAQWDRAWAVANHKAAQAVAEKYGLKYTRRKN